MQIAIGVSQHICTSEVKLTENLMQLLTEGVELTLIPSKMMAM